MPDEVIKDPSGEQAGASGGAAGASGDTPDVKALQKQVAEYEKRIGELTDSERYWADRAKAGAPAAKPKTPADEPVDDDLLEGLLADVSDDGDPETAEKFVEELASGGVAALKKRGFVTLKDAERMAAQVAAKVSTRAVQKAVNQLMADQALTRDYEGIGDESSEMFKATSEEFKKLTGGDPAAAKDRRLLRAAAEIAKAKIQAASAAKPKPRQADIDAQMGDVSSFGSGYQDEHGDDLSPIQRSIILKFNSDGVNQVSEEDYRKRAAKVTMGRIPAGVMRRGA